MMAVCLRGIGKRYGTVVAVDGVDLDVPVGSRTVIVGPSGSGKTTLLRLVAGFEAPDTGRVLMAGETVAEGPMAVPAHRREIGFVPQDGALFPHLSVGANIGFGLERRMPQREARIVELLDMVELPRHMRDRRPHELSGGQQQRVALARALARQPRLMLLDEPFSALDTGLRASMRKSVTRLLDAAGITAIMVTHDQAEALSFADQMVVLREGRLAQAGPPQEVYTRPRDVETASFLGEAIVLAAELDDGWAACELGRIPADSDGRRGPARIMLRPEQLRLEPDTPSAAPGDAASPLCHGLVTEVEYGGALSTLAVVLQPAAADGPAMGVPPLLIRWPSAALPARGTQVRIAVSGKAHVF